MCGIAGIMNVGRLDYNIERTRHIIKDMTDSIAHRGPDDGNHIVLDDGKVYLGHRRLAIIDLTDSAKQPMSNYNGRYTIVYNGEVYNYLELRRELENLGCGFCSNSDTEVVLQAYAKWGIDSFLKFNGIFSFAIWDNKKKELVIVRDRYGAKPLYYAYVRGQLLFASEYKAILKHPDYTWSVNKHAIKEYFTFQNIFSDQTFFEEIRLLPAGTFIKITYDKGTIIPIKYWDYNFVEEYKNITRDECAEELDRLFNQAVRRQLVSDVPVGSYLSGGIDSGSITAIASKLLPYMKTFTCGFDLHSASGLELSYDEREKAEYMSYLFGTEHYEMVLKSGDMERCIKDLVWHIEDPRVGQSYPNYYASKLSAQFVKVVLAGTGGDELFGGYPWRYYRAANSRSFDEYVGNYYVYWQRLLDENEMVNVLSPMYYDIKDYSTLDVFRDTLRERMLDITTPEQNINNSLYLEAKTFLNGLLIVEDKISMAHGLETRVPFLDNDLVEFAMKMPVKYKINNLYNITRIDENSFQNKQASYFNKSNDGKMLLRSVMKKYIPESVTKDVKQGFSAPDASWFRGESIEYVKSIVDNSNSKMYQYLDKKSVQKSIQGHFKGTENRRLLIWAYLNFENWLQLFT